MKDLLKPTLFIVILTIFLLVATYFIPKKAEICSMGPDGLVCGKLPVSGFGWPIFYGEGFAGDAVERGFFLGHFVINIILYYLISVLLIFLLKKITHW